jgi:putative peptidoglycan lipid II flippase
MTSLRKSGTLMMTGRLVGGALLGKILGFLREVEMARLLGASFVTDSFRSALTAVLLPIAPLQGEIIPSVLIPLHREWSEKGTAVRLFGSLTAGFFALSVLLAVCVWCLAGAWVDLIVPGFSAEAHELTIRFVRIMSLSIPGSVLLANLMCIELATGRSRVAAIRASVQNVGLMIGVVVLAFTGDVDAIAWAFVIAFNGVTCLGAYWLWREGQISLGSLSLRDAYRAISVFLPRVKALMTQPIFDQANTLLERVLASAVAVGAIASMDYARTLSESLLFLLAQPIGFVVLAGGRPSTERIRLVSRSVLGIALPVSCYFAWLAPDIVRVVLERGAFDERAVAMTAGAVRGISLGLWAASLGYVFIRMLNAQGRNRAAALVISASYAANMAMNVVASRLWGTFGLGVGESLRGLVLLLGSALCLGCMKELMELGRPLLVPSLAVLASCFLTTELLHDPLLRVVVAGSATGVAMLAWYAVAVPQAAVAIRERVFGRVPRVVSASESAAGE